jgi:hypothetical protein
VPNLASTLQSMHSLAVRLQPELLLIVCLCTALSLFLSLLALVRCRQLREELIGFRRLTQKLVSSEEKRMLQELKRNADSSSKS